MSCLLRTRYERHGDEFSGGVLYDNPLGLGHFHHFLFPIDIDDSVACHDFNGCANMAFASK